MPTGLGSLPNCWCLDGGKQSDDQKVRLCGLVEMMLRLVGITHKVAAVPCGGRFHNPLDLHGGTSNTESHGINVRNGQLGPKQTTSCNRSHMGGFLGGGQRQPLGEGGGKESQVREDESFILAMTHAQRDMQWGPWHMCKGIVTGVRLSPRFDVSCRWVPESWL